VEFPEIAAVKLSCNGPEAPSVRERLSDVPELATTSVALSLTFNVSASWTFTLPVQELGEPLIVFVAVDESEVVSWPVSLPVSLPVTASEKLSVLVSESV
jgi:hypothetical protein